MISGYRKSSVSCSLRLFLILVVMKSAAASTADVFVEHEVSVKVAKEAANKLELDKMTDKPGCEECSWFELRYCLSYRVLRDHCCCDKRYREWFPYVPHTCYLESEYCDTIATNCEEYSRIRTCCCDQHTSKKWKDILSSGDTVHPALSVILLSIFIAIHNTLLTT